MFADKIAEEILIKAVEDAFYSCALEWAWTSDPDVLVECFGQEIRRIAKGYVESLSPHIINEKYEEQIVNLLVARDDTYLDGFRDGKIFVKENDYE